MNNNETMSINELKNENNDNVSINPNILRKRQQQNTSDRIEEFIPEEHGFKKEPPEQLEVQKEMNKIYDSIDVAIERRQREAMEFVEALEQSEGKLSEEEFRDMNGESFITDKEKEFEDIQNRKNPNRSQNRDQKKQMHQVETTEPETFDPDNISTSDEEFEELERELSKDTDFIPAIQGTTTPAVVTAAKQPVKKVTDIKIKEHKEIEKKAIDILDSDDLDDLEIDEDKELQAKANARYDKLKSAIKEKISPITNTFDISTFTISSAPISVNSTLENVNINEKVIDWVLMSSCLPISMRSYTGSEIDFILNNGNQNRIHSLRDQWNMIYDHIVDPNKPKTFEQWARSISFLDLDHIWFAIYIACFGGINYLPYTCNNDNCDEVILTDDTPIMNMAKFKDDEAKKKFQKIYNMEDYGDITNTSLYTSEVVQVSDNYAFSFKEPSLYNMVFENAELDDEFLRKFDSKLLNIIVYIDNIYYIDRVNKRLQPISIKKFPNNISKSTKAKIIQFSKVIKTLTSDQYEILLSYINKINETETELTYVLPEVTCPKCGTIIEEQTYGGRDLVFTRHQLATMATL